MRKRPEHIEPCRDSAEQMLRRVWRLRRRGDDRRSFVELRTAAYRNEDDAKLWTLFGAECVRLGKLEAARQAYKHAAWLRERARQHGKAKTTRRLLADLQAA